MGPRRPSARRRRRRARVLRRRRPGRRPALLALGAYDAEAEGEDPLRLKPHPLQFHGEAPPPEALLRETWDEVVTRRVFGQDHPPRWVLVFSFSRVLLIERGKWTHNRLLRFDLDEILGRRDDATLKAAAALLHRDCLLPPDGRSLLDSLDENSHKHAFAVSEDLKYALRESIELIGNEAVRYLREVLKDKVYDRPDDALAGRLGLECLRYMYRLLFLFYIEARPDLGYAPMDSETYLKGYSLEHLRDLEMVRLTTDESLDGYYLHHAVQTLFGLIRDGFDGTQRGGAPDLLAAGPGARLHHGFRIRALDSALFRAGSTPLLDRVKLRNRVLQRVVRLMSLTRPAKGRRGRRGRISYAQLGINQLGAVYEALLSYRGFFAEEDLYEVKKAGDLRIPVKPITHSGRNRSPIPVEIDHSFRPKPITRSEQATRDMNHESRFSRFFSRPVSGFAWNLPSCAYFGPSKSVRRRALEILPAPPPRRRIFRGSTPTATAGRGSGPPHPPGSRPSAASGESSWTAGTPRPGRGRKAHSCYPSRRRWSY